MGIANNQDTPIILEADQGVFLNTGAEPIAGSTRMNAGTAQRIALNLLSSLVMIRLGRVYRGMMVDVQSTNAKLARRKIAMTSYLTGVSEDEARVALDRAGGNVKVAVLILHGCEHSVALAVLKQAGGRLRRAIEQLGSAQEGARTITANRNGGTKRALV